MYKARKFTNIFIKALHLSLLASLSDSRRARMSPILTGPLTFLTRRLALSLFTNSTLTCEIPPLDPIRMKTKPGKFKSVRKDKMFTQVRCKPIFQDQTLYYFWFIFGMSINWLIGQSLSTSLYVMSIGPWKLIWQWLLRRVTYLFYQ